MQSSLIHAGIRRYDVTNFFIGDGRQVPQNIEAGEAGTHIFLTGLRFEDEVGTYIGTQGLSKKFGLMCAEILNNDKRCNFSARTCTIPVLGHTAHQYWHASISTFALPSGTISG